MLQPFEQVSRRGAARSGRARLNWEQFRRLLARYPLPSTRVGVFSPPDPVTSVSKKRWRVTNKTTACGVYGSKTFGENLFVTAQKNHNIVEAETTLFLSDGDPARGMGWTRKGAANIMRVRLEMVVPTNS